MKNKKKATPFGIWTGSSPEEFVVLREGIAASKALNFRLTLNKSQIKAAISAESEERFYLAGSDKARATHLVKLIKNPKVKEILCTRGGYGNLRLLPILDKMQITPSGPKRIWGYSDTTVIQHYLFDRFGWPWVHSPMLCSHSFIDPTRKEKIALNKIFVNGKEDVQHKLKILNKGKLKRGKHSCPIFGGNLMSLVSMIGSKWQPKFSKKFFLFIEDIGEAPYRLDRLLQMLFFSGLLKNCQGVLLGHFTACPGYKAVIKLWATEHNLFLASKLNMGHNSPNIPHLIGESVTIQLQNAEKALIHFPELGIY